MQGSYCLSEADAGSDVAAMRTRAVRDGDHYVLTGTKYWITNAGVSDLYTVFAVTDPDAGRRGISCFVVETDWGVEVGPHEDKMGLRGSPTARGHLRRGAGAGRQPGRGGGDGVHHRHAHPRSQSAHHRGTGGGDRQGAIDCAAGYMKERKAFGKPIADLQGLRFMLADMAMRTEAARTMIYRACSLIDSAIPRAS